MVPRKRNALATVLFPLVLSGAALAFAGDPPAAAPANPTGPPGSAAATAPSTHVVRVYYFHTKARCASCKKIEAFTDEAIREGFAQELANGSMIWQAVDVEEPGNRRFIQDYKLFTKSVVVVDLVNGGQVRWKNLAKVWQLLADQPAFVRYVQDEVRQYVEGRP